MTRASTLFSFLAVLAVLGLTGCDRPPPTTPTTTTTATTTTATTATTTAAMQVLATELGGLQETLTVSALDPVAVERAIAGLNALSSRAKALQGKGTEAHPLVRAGMPSFVADVESARAALQRQPPDPEPARMLAQSCRACHALASWSPPSSSSSSSSTTALAQR